MITDKRSWRKKWKDELTGYLLAAPALILFAVIGLYTVLFSVYISFFHVSQGSLISNAVYAGFNNYKDFLFGRDLILSDAFWQAILNNLIIALCMLVIGIPLALILAIILQESRFGKGFFRTVFLVPMITSSIAIYYVWTGIYDPSGSLNQLLRAVGLDSLVAYNGWFGELDRALPSIIVMLLWGSVPSSMILFFAGLQTIDPHLQEAAEIDGASFMQRVVHVIWPILRPITVIAVILVLNGSLQVFEQIWSTTKGGPAGATQVVNNLIFQEAFESPTADMGRANAMAWSVGLLTFALSLLSLRVFKDKT